ncbi:MAG: endonuclease/exonuclease/phosphatase family protein, partial [Acetobacteraceae bacterium]|nr:endonuclease/exonuclease/phosphatase family protein [Acetobacteraceae bacterium]
MIRILFALLLLLGTAQAGELKVSTWNLEWLTSNPEDLPDGTSPKPAAGIEALRRYALLLDADIIAIEEVDGPAIAAQVFPPDRYQIFMTHDRVKQRVGIVVRRGIAARQNGDLAALDL